MDNLLSKVFGTRLSFYAIAVLSVALVVLWGWYRWHMADAEADLVTATAQVQQLQGVNQQNAIAMAVLIKQHELDLKAIAAATVAAAVRAAESATLHERITNAKPSDDGPVAAVLRNLLDSLRR